MKASDLRIGDIVSVCYETRIIPDKVIVLEPNVVHLSNRKYPDNEKDIMAVPLSKKWLVHFGFIYNRQQQIWRHAEITIIEHKARWQVKWINLNREIQFVHQLQNLLHFANEYK